MNRIGAQLRQYCRFRAVGRLQPFRLNLRLRLDVAYIQFIKDVVDAGHKFRPFLYQLVAAAARKAEYIVRHGEDFASLIQRV